MLSQIIFVIILSVGVAFFIRNFKTILRNIRLGKPKKTDDNKKQRLRRMLLLSFGQSKMTARPVVAILHFLVYFGFVIINLEMLEIILDGILGTHRIFANPLGKIYNFLIFSFEILAFLVIVSVFIFWTRRNALKISRLNKKELNGFPKKDANNILYIEAVLMILFLLMNACDFLLQQKGVYPSGGNFPVSGFLTPLFSSFSAETLIYFERFCWWGHIVGVLFFLNYLCYSKHLHILFAFPYSYFADVKPKGQIDNLPEVTTEVKLMLDPSADPFSASTPAPEKFGVSDATDLSWVEILSAYTCTECGRCTDLCPANQTGKLLSPRKIMMATRDRIEEIGKDLNLFQTKNPKNNTENISFEEKLSEKTKNNPLLGGYISSEEIWACTSCQACIEACPLDINPLQIIIKMRQYLVMEKSSSPSALNSMFSSIENAGSPWGYSPQEREFFKF